MQYFINKFIKLLEFCLCIRLICTYNLPVASVDSLLQVDVPEVVVLVAASVLLTVLIELPFQNIRNILVKNPK